MCTKVKNSNGFYYRLRASILCTITNRSYHLKMCLPHLHTHTLMYTEQSRANSNRDSHTHTHIARCMSEGNRYRPLNNSNWLLYDGHFFAPLLSQHILAHHKMVQSTQRLAEMPVVKRLGYINISCKIIDRHRRRNRIIYQYLHLP